MEGLIGLLIWIAGNYFYYEYRKEGERSGFKRFVSFWMGFPLSSEISKSYRPLRKLNRSRHQKGTVLFWGHPFRAGREGI